MMKACSPAKLSSRLEAKPERRDLAPITREHEIFRWINRDLGPQHILVIKKPLVS